MTRLPLAILSAAIALTLAAPGYARSRAGLGDAYPQACAPGYHADAGGNCQPNVAEANRYCPAGTVFHPTFDNWTCDPAPREAY